MICGKKQPEIDEHILLQIKAQELGIEKYSWNNKEGIDFIFIGNPGIVQDLEVLPKFPSTGHRMFGRNAKMNLKRERRNLVKSYFMQSVRARIEELKISLRNKFALLNENDESVYRLNYNLTTAIAESAAAMRQAEFRKQTGKLTHKTNELIGKCKNMKVPSTVDDVELVKLCKLINTNKTNDIRAYNMVVI